jgi:hypothetical protein
MGRPRKEPTQVASTRLPESLAVWLEGAHWSARRRKTDIISSAIELYLALVAPDERPDDYELTEEVSGLLADMNRRTSALGELVGVVSAARGVPTASGEVGCPRDPLNAVEEVLKRHGLLDQ